MQLIWSTWAHCRQTSCLGSVWGCFAHCLLGAPCSLVADVAFVVHRLHKLPRHKGALHRCLCHRRHRCHCAHCCQCCLCHQCHCCHRCHFSCCKHQLGRSCFIFSVSGSEVKKKKLLRWMILFCRGKRSLKIFWEDFHCHHWNNWNRLIIVVIIIIIAIIIIIIIATIMSMRGRQAVSEVSRGMTGVSIWESQHSLHGESQHTTTHNTKYNNTITHNTVCTGSHNTQ